MSSATLPLASFLDLLRAEGFPIGVDSWLRVQALLDRCDGAIEPPRLKHFLGPVIASTPEELRRFGEVFDRYYTLLGPVREAAPLAPSARTGRAPVLRSRKWSWRLILAAGLAVCAIAIGLVIAFPRHHPVSQRTAGLPGGALKSQPRTGGAGRAQKETLPRPADTFGIHVDAVPVDTTRLDRLRLLWTIPAVLLALYAVWRLLRRYAGRYLAPGSSAPPRWFRDIAARVPIAAPPEISHGVRRLRRRIPEPSTRLDLPATIESTIRAAGFPRFRFLSTTRRPEYLVLIDRVASRDHQALLFNELIGALREKGQLAIDEYFYTRDPRVCVSAKTGAATYLADLLPRLANHRLLIFGDGAALWNSITGEHASWMGMLSFNRQMALLTPHHDGWTARENALSQWMRVRPATLEGISQVLDAFEQRPEPPSAGDASAAPQYPAVESKQRMGAYVEELRRYLGPRVFQLTAACALYPRLEWDLTLQLAAAIDPRLLDHANLLKLVNLPWFRRGFYPLALQEQLHERLSKSERRRLRGKIIELMQTGAISSSDSVTSLEVIVQKFDLSPKEREKLAPDEALVRLSMTAGRSRLALRIPETVRRALFRFGVPAFGMRLHASLPLAAFAIAGVVAAATILPPIASLHVTLNPPKPPADLAMKTKSEGSPQASAYRPDPKSFTGPQISRFYNFPPGLDGTGQSIGIIELGGGYKDADLDAYFNGLLIKRPKVSSVGVDGAKNSPEGTLNGSDGEVYLDIEAAGSVAPGANIVLYFAPNTNKGFLNALTAAVNDTTHRNSVININWGSPEESYSAQDIQAFNTVLQSASAKGITVCGGSGDNGDGRDKSDKPSVFFPVSSPWMLAVGGTRLFGAGSVIKSEIAWSTAPNAASGGGFSSVFSQPDWQKGIRVPAQSAMPASSSIVSQGRFVLPGGSKFDFDDGTTDAGTAVNVWWAQAITGAWSFGPINGAKVANLGVVNFDGVSLAQLQKLSYGDSLAPGTDESKVLVPGDVLALATNGGNYAKILVTGPIQKDYGLPIQWVTYRPAQSTTNKEQQQSTAAPGRGIPDVAAVADPATGLQIFGDGQAIVVGGTNLSAPIWAGLIAVLNQGLGRPIGYLNPILYQQLGPKGVLRDITQGDNRINGIGYSAGPGWDPVTGWGSPDGVKLLNALRSSPR